MVVYMGEKKFYTASFKNVTIHIPVEDIYYFEVYNRRVTLFSKQFPQGFSFNSTMKKVQSELNHLGARFFKAHQSYLINNSQLFMLQKDSLILFCGKEIPVSRCKKMELKDLFLQAQGSLND